MDLTQVTDYISNCDPSELSTINDALSDRLDALFAPSSDAEPATESEPVEEEVVVEEEWAPEAPMSF